MSNAASSDPPMFTNVIHLETGVAVPENQFGPV
jgi:hypothetical protein